MTTDPHTTDAAPPGDALAMEVAGVDVTARTLTVGPLVLSAGRTKGRQPRVGVERGRYGDRSWFIEVHVFGLFLGLYR